ncbi:unnamed protein product [Darwinula stevensoni]|uniref:Uncharacterized protein n=1 Tax=Darwinula stevensoni TaxID=69355 RepID=A0A7R9ABM4_9CRUS|nr:unnamed protein product [Darwinula stevensoni]CAG0899310.1 unnamed protein product [Darwinula stevensoni]
MMARKLSLVWCHMERFSPVHLHHQSTFHRQILEIEESCFWRVEVGERYEAHWVAYLQGYYTPGIGFILPDMQPDDIIRKYSLALILGFEMDFDNHNNT